MKLDKSWHAPFSVTDVYKAWISPDSVIPPATRLEISATTGGHYRLIIDSPDFAARAGGLFSRVEPDHRLTYSWQWNGTGCVTEIDVTFSASDEGTRIRLVHSGFDDAESRDQHDSGWDNYISGLSTHLMRLAST